MNNLFQKTSHYLKNIKRHLEQKQEQEMRVIPLPDNPDPTHKVHISMLSVFQAAIVVLGVILLANFFAELSDILITFLIALFLSAAFTPAVNFFEYGPARLFATILQYFKTPEYMVHFVRRGLPRGVAIILVFIMVFGFCIFLGSKVAPIIGDQLLDISQNLEEWGRHFLATKGNGSYWEQKLYSFVSWFLEEENIQKIIEGMRGDIKGITINLQGIMGKGVDILVSTFAIVFNIFLALMLTFFLLLDQKQLGIFFRSLFPRRHQEYLGQKTMLVQQKIGEWIHGQILLFFMVGGITYVAFTFLGIQYALTFAMVFGLAEFVPYVGPAISFLVSAPVAFSQSTTTGIGLLIFYAVFQMVEGNILVPLVMSKTVGLPPVVVIIALIVGASFPDYINPIMGMILAVPVATILSLFVSDFTSREKS